MSCLLSIDDPIYGSQELAAKPDLSTGPLWIPNRILNSLLNFTSWSTDSSRHQATSSFPRRHGAFPEIVCAEERSRTWDAHQVNEAELIVLPMDWLSKKQSGRVVPTAIGLGMANLTMD